MKILKKIMVSTLALLLSATFIFVGYANTDNSNSMIAYADSTIDLQREQLASALEDKDYVRSTQSYQNAAKKDVNAYEAAIEVGENLLNKESASVQELYEATKNIDISAKYLTTSANILYIKNAVRKSERNLVGLEYIKNNMPNSYRRYKKQIDGAISSLKSAIAKANNYIARNEIQ